MRSALFELCLIVVGIVCIHTVRIIKGSTINGKLYPATSESVLAINGNDSVRTTSKNGYFGIKVSPGVWKVIVAANKSSRNVIRENLKVDDGENVNLGEIRLSE